MASRRDIFGRLAALGGLSTLMATTSAKAQTLRKRFIKRERPEQSGYSLAVITEGAGKTIWLAGQTGVTDSSGKSLAGDFDAQVRQVFANLAATLEESGYRAGHRVHTFRHRAQFVGNFLGIRVILGGKDDACRQALEHRLCGIGAVNLPQLRRGVDHERDAHVVSG